MLGTALTLPLFIPIQQPPTCQEPATAQHVWPWGPVPVPPLCPVPMTQLSAIKEGLNSQEVKIPQGFGARGSRGEARLGSPFPKLPLLPHLFWLLGGMDSIVHVKGCTTAIGCRLMATIDSVGPMTVKETCSYQSFLQPRKAEIGASWMPTSLWVLELLLLALLLPLTHFP